MVGCMADVGRSEHTGGALGAPPLAIPSQVERDARLAELAARQGRAVGRDQLLRIGFTRRSIEHAVRSKRLQLWHPQVYVAGPGPPTLHGRQFAALLACRPDPLLSHLSMLARVGVAEERRRIHVTTVNRGGGKRLRGVTVHRVRSIDPADVTRVDDLPCTTIPRGLLDIAETEQPWILEKAFEALDRKGWLDFEAIERCAHRTPAAAVASPSFPSLPDTSQPLVRRKASNGSSSCCCRRRDCRFQTNRSRSTASESTATGPRMTSSLNSTRKASTRSGLPASATWSATPTCSRSGSPRSA